MGNSVFADLIANLGQQVVDKSHSVSADEYQTWKHGYLFDALQDLRYGQSFCNAFGITDNILFYSQDHEYADHYIRKHYVK